MSKTRIVSTYKAGSGKKKSKKDQLKRLTRKVHRTHKGYSMKRITNAQMTYKRGRRKR